MAKYTVSLSEFAEIVRDMPKKQREVVYRGTEAGLMRAVNLLQMRSPVDTGLYAASWQFSRQGDRFFIGNTAPHAAILEEGARPHIPPIGPLLAWAKRILRDPSQPPKYSPEVWAMAKGVQKKIGEQGQEGRFILKNALNDITDIVKAEIDRALKGGR